MSGSPPGYLVALAQGTFRPGRYSKKDFSCWCSRRTVSSSRRKGLATENKKLSHHFRRCRRHRRRLAIVIVTAVAEASERVSVVVVVTDLAAFVALVIFVASNRLGLGIWLAPAMSTSSLST